MEAAIIRLNLYDGDVLSLSGDVLITGARSPVLSTFSDDEQRCDPVVLVDRPHSKATAALRASTKAFGRVVALKCRFGRLAGDRIADDLSDVLGHCIGRWQARSIVMLPLSWRHPRIVAFNMLYAVWLLACFQPMILGGSWPDPIITIATLRDGHLFAELLDDDARLLRAAVRERYDAARETAVFGRLSPLYERSVAFQVRRNCQEQA